MSSLKYDPILLEQKNFICSNLIIKGFFEVMNLEYMLKIQNMAIFNQKF